ncbi:MAG: diphthine synthase [Nitrososphaerota archaeon]
MPQGMTINFVGLGLGSKDYLTRAAEEALLESEKVYLDMYTGHISSELIDYLRDLLKDRLIFAERTTIENNLYKIIDEASRNKIAIATSGDPFIATTHIAILLEAVKRGICVKVIHGVSIISAAASYSGLSAYKFGRIVTVPRAASMEIMEGIYRVIANNQEHGLHTLVLLDTADGGVTAQEAAEYLSRIEEKLGWGLFRDDRIAVVLLHVGMRTASKKCYAIKDLKELSLPPPPHVMILPGELNFVEKESLKMIAYCDYKMIDNHHPISTSRQRAKKYIDKTQGVLGKIRKEPIDLEAQEVVELASTYVYDSQSFLLSGRTEDSLIAISYAEGLLDCLRMLGKVSFKW